MSCRPTLGVVVATHERPSLLQGCLESICRQTVPPDQVVIVDDGTVETAEGVAQEFKDRLPITYAQSGGAGVGAARNMGSGLVDCDWIVIQDDDDLMLPRRLECHMRDIQTRPLDVSYGGWINFDAPGQSLEFYPGKALTVEAFFLAGLVLTHGAAAVRTDVLQAYPYSETHAAGVDFDFFARLIMDGAFFGHCGGYLILRRLHPVRLGALENSVQHSLRQQVVERWTASWGDIDARRAQAAAQPFFPAALGVDDIAVIMSVGVEAKRLVVPVNRRWVRARPTVDVLTSAGLSPKIIDSGLGARVSLEVPLDGADDGRLARLSVGLADQNALVQWRGDPLQGQAPVLQSPVSAQPGIDLRISTPDISDFSEIVERVGGSRWLWGLSSASPTDERDQSLCSTDFETITGVPMDFALRAEGTRAWLAHLSTLEE